MLTDLPTTKPSALTAKSSALTAAAPGGARYAATAAGQALAGLDDLGQLVLALGTTTMTAEELKALLAASSAALVAQSDPDFAEAADQQRRMACQLGRLLRAGVAAGLLSAPLAPSRRLGIERRDARMDVGMPPGPPANVPGQA